MLLKEAGGKVQALDEQRRADALRGLHPLLVEDIEPDAKILALARPSAQPSRRIDTLPSSTASRCDATACTGQPGHAVGSSHSPAGSPASNVSGSERNGASSAEVSTRRKAMPGSMPPGRWNRLPVKRRNADDARDRRNHQPCPVPTPLPCTAPGGCRGSPTPRGRRRPIARAGCRPRRRGHTGRGADHRAGRGLATNWSSGPPPAKPDELRNAALTTRPVTIGSCPERSYS